MTIENNTWIVDAVLSTHEILTHTPAYLNSLPCPFLQPPAEIAKIQILDLSNYVLRTVEEVTRLFDLLNQNPQIHTLKCGRITTTNGNEMTVNSQQRLRMFSTLLAINTTLTSLIMARNNIGDDAITLLATEGIAFNQQLQHLDVSRTYIGEQGFNALLEALKKNQALISLDISRIILTTNPEENNVDSFSSLADMLEANKTLKTLIIDESFFNKSDQTLNWAKSGIFVDHPITKLQMAFAGCSLEKLQIKKQFTPNNDRDREKRNAERKILDYLLRNNQKLKDQTYCENKTGNSWTNFFKPKLKSSKPQQEIISDKHLPGKIRRRANNL